MGPSQAVKGPAAEGGVFPRGLFQQPDHIDHQAREVDVEDSAEAHQQEVIEPVEDGRCDPGPVLGAFGGSEITLEDAVKADEIFTILMGEKVEPRKEFIEENAKYVVNLDI